MRIRVVANEVFTSKLGEMIMIQLNGHMIPTIILASSLNDLVKQLSESNLPLGRLPEDLDSLSPMFIGHHLQDFVQIWVGHCK